MQEIDNWLIINIHELAELFVGMCESSVLLLEYSVEYIIEYRSTRLLTEIATNNYRCGANLTDTFSFKFVL